MKYLISLIVFAFVTCTISFAFGEEIGDKRIVKFINGKIKVKYWKHTTKYILDKNDYDDFIFFMKEIKQVNLVNYTEKQNGNKFIFHLKPTKESKSIPVNWKDDGESQFAIPIEKRKIDKLVKVKQEDAGDRVKITAYFTYTITPSKKAKLLEFEKRQFKGRAYITYDIFTDKLSLEDLDYSRMQKTDWKNNEWAEIIDGKLTLVH